MFPSSNQSLINPEILYYFYSETQITVTKFIHCVKSSQSGVIYETIHSK